MSYKNRHFNEFRNKINEQNQFFTKEIKIIKKNWTEMLELKNSMTQVQNVIENISDRADQMEERINDLEMGI